MKKNQLKHLEIRNIITEIKTSIDGSYSRSIIWRENQLTEGQIWGYYPNATQSDKEITNRRESCGGTHDRIWKSNVCLVRVPQDENRESGGEAILRWWLRIFHNSSKLPNFRSRKNNV